MGGGGGEVMHKEGTNGKREIQNETKKRRNKIKEDTEKKIKGKWGQ